MNRVIAIAVCVIALAVIGLGAPDAQAGDEAAPVGVQAEKWYKRLACELEDLERRMSVLDGVAVEPSEATAASIDKNLARALLQLTNRIFDLEKRLRGLERGTAVTKPPTAHNPGGTSPAGAASTGSMPNGAMALGTDGANGSNPEKRGASDAAAAVKRKKDRTGGGKSRSTHSSGRKRATGMLPYLRNRRLVGKIPQPRKLDGLKVYVDGGVKKAELEMKPPAGSTGPSPEKPATTDQAQMPGMKGWSCLVMDAPIIGVTMTVVNTEGFMFEGEEWVHIRYENEQIKTNLKWEGETIELSEDVTLYIEHLSWAMGLKDVIGMIEAPSAEIMIGVVKFLLSRAKKDFLEDLCSIFHPQNVGLLR